MELRLNRLLGPSLLLAMVVPMMGCGLITKCFSGTLKADFTVRGMNNTPDPKCPTPAVAPSVATFDYCDLQTIDPNENPDVRDNRSRIKAGTGTIRSITVTITSLDPDNAATVAWGELHARRHLDTPFNPTDAPLGLFESVPVTAGQQINIAQDADTRAKISDLVFVQEGDGKIDIAVEGHADLKPSFSGQVEFDVEFCASL